MMDNVVPGTGSFLIKRYADARFYDTARLIYLSLDDISELVLARQRFVVRDAATGADITGEILQRLQ